MTNHDERGAIGFAEKVLELLDEARYTATYKYAVLLALLDVCLEHTQSTGEPPDVITTRQLAEKTVEIYWPHTVPFAVRAQAAVLRQTAIGRATIVSTIVDFRERHAPDPSVPRWQARMAARAAYDRLECHIEWKLINMPLPRLQIIGQSERRFIYEINWDQHVEKREVTDYQNGNPSTFDNRIFLKAQVGEYLLQLASLMRPLIQRRWAAMVAQLNQLEDSRLEEFLFGASRTPTVAVRAGLWEIQERRCFYCASKLKDPTHGEVDHFVPWSRYPDEGLDNFVVADRACNGFKGNSLAAANHLKQWARRLETNSSVNADLADLAGQTSWHRHSLRTMSVVRAIYLRLPRDARLWLRQRDFVAPDTAAIGAALQVAPERQFGPDDAPASGSH